VADDLRADFDKFLLPGIAANERVAGLIPIGQRTISAGPPTSAACRHRDAVLAQDFERSRSK
jgi:hypothetical protein